MSNSNNSNLTGNYGFNFTNTGIQIADANDIKNAVMTLFVNAFALQNKQLNTSDQTPQGQLAISLADIINNKNIDLLTLANNLDINKASGLWLDMLCKLWNLERKPAEPTVVSCTVTGLQGTVITSGVSKAKDLSGNTYVASQTVTIGASGTATVNFQNETGGAIGCPAHTLNSIITTTSGWDTIDNATAGAIGSNIENDADLRKRYNTLVANNASGTLSGLVTAILGLDGVLDCAGGENTLNADIQYGGYTINPSKYAISILGGTDSQIAETIYNKKSASLQNGNTTVSYTDTVIGQTYTFNIVRPTQLSYYFAVTLANQAGLPADIADLVKDAIYNNFYGLTADSIRVKINSTTYASRFFTPINLIKSGIDIVSITMASQPAGGSISTYGNSVICGFAQYPYLDKANIAVSFSS